MASEPTDPPRSACARAYARQLLDELGAADRTPLPALAERHPDLEWAASGAMALTGRADGPPLLVPTPLASCARGALAALAAVARAAGLDRNAELGLLDGAALLGERAALSAFSRRGRTSAGGSCHLLRCLDGWIAVNLARADDVSLLPAWLGASESVSESESGMMQQDPRAFVAGRVAQRSMHDLVAAARELGLPVAPAERPSTEAPPWLRVALRGRSLRKADSTSPLVVDLSSLWAGPLATHLLALAGARVIKVESTQRPDGARRGPQRFYDLLNAGKRSVALDVRETEGRRALAALLERAEIVVEASRPRALEQLGIDAESFVGNPRGKVWVSITGYGRREPQRNWVAFGDDAGAAAGLVVDEAPGTVPPSAPYEQPVFCADAIPDPLTGIHAALAALTAWTAAESVLLDVSLHDVAAHLAAEDARGRRLCAELPRSSVRRSVATGERATWEVFVGAEVQPVVEPRGREPMQRAAALGTDTSDVLRELVASC